MLWMKSSGCFESSSHLVTSVKPPDSVLSLVLSLGEDWGPGKFSNFLKTMQLEMADLGHESQCVWRHRLCCSSLCCTNWVSNSQPPGGETAIWFTKVDPSSMAFPALSLQAQFHRMRRACFRRTQGTACSREPLHFPLTGGKLICCWT